MSRTEQPIKGPDIDFHTSIVVESPFRSKTESEVGVHRYGARQSVRLEGIEIGG